MADDKKNIPDAGKVDEPPKPGKVEPVKADSSVQDQPAPAKADASVVEGASKVATPPTAEQPAPADKEAPKDKVAPAPSMEGTPQPGKDEKQTTIPSIGDPAPAGKVVDFTAARDGATKGKPPEKAAAPDKGKQTDKVKDGPARADKAAPDKAKPQPRDKMSQSKPPAGKGAPVKTETPAATEQSPAPRDATRGVKEEIVYLNLSDLHPFKNHPFGVRDDAEMQGLVESVKAAGVNQPALVRPREGGGYEIIAGHRRQRASELAGFVNMPCIVRNMTDDEAILAMTDDNLRHREKILPTEKAAALKQQVEAIKHQGARPGEDDRDAGKRSTQIVGDRNSMNYKQVQRYIRLTELVPDLQKMVDEKQLSFTPAVEISFIRPRHQRSDFILKMAVSYININKQADKSLAELINLGRRYVAGAEALWPKYREACNRNKGLYTSEAMEQQKQEAKREYRAQLLNMFNEMWRDVGVEVDLMKETLACWVSEPANPAFLAQISAYRDFDRTLSRTELEALVEGAGGNYVCLRCLDKLAQKSDFKVSVPSVDDFGRDLEQIKRDFWGLRLYGPVGDGDVLDLLPDVVTYSGQQMGAPTVTQATMAWQAARNLDKHLEEIRGRWANSVQPMITVTEDVYGADQQDTQEEADRIKAEKEENRTTSESVTVEGSGTDGVEMARKMGQEIAQGQAKAGPLLQSVWALLVSLLEQSPSLEAELLQWFQLWQHWQAVAF